MALAVVLGGACADNCANSATWNHKQRQLAAQVYHDLPRVVAELRQLLSEHGYTLPEKLSPASLRNKTTMTPWKGDRRWLVRINMLDGKRFQVRLSSQWRDKEGKLHLNQQLRQAEWTLFERVAPARARAVKQAAAKRGEQAAAGCHGCMGCARLTFGC